MPTLLQTPSAQLWRRFMFRILCEGESITIMAEIG
jgi:hypothetical protein